MLGQHDRTIALIGEGALEKLKNSRVAVIGLGGVGSFAVEALARSGIGSLLIADCDTFAPSNLNRQLNALTDTVSKPKTEVTKQRILQINPSAEVVVLEKRISRETDSSVFDGCDYIIDAIDDVEGKLFLCQCAKEKRIPIIASMGTGNKTDPTALKVTDIFKTQVCPLCRVMRKKLKDNGITSLRVVYSEEIPAQCAVDENGKRTPSSMIFVPASAGLLLAKETVFGLIDGVE